MIAIKTLINTGDMRKDVHLSAFISSEYLKATLTDHHGETQEGMNIRCTSIAIVCILVLYLCV